MAQHMHHDADTTDDMQHGYQAAAAGQVDFRHSRYWIDDSTGAELCRPDVVRGILNFYRDADAKDAAETVRSLGGSLQ